MDSGWYSSRIEGLFALHHSSKFIEDLTLTIQINIEVHCNNEIDEKLIIEIETEICYVFTLAFTLR